MLGLASGLATAGFATGMTLLLALVFAKYAGIKDKTEKAFTWVGAGAVSFVLGGVLYALKGGLWTKLDAVQIGTYGLYLFQVIGLILVLVGSVWAIFDLLTQNL